MFCVYELNDKNGLFYIGKSEDLSQRIRVHKSDIKNGGTCSSTQLDINFQYRKKNIIKHTKKRVKKIKNCIIKHTKNRLKNIFKNTQKRGKNMIKKTDK